MKTKGPFPLTGFKDFSLHPLIETYLQLNQLKQLYRQGWLRRGLPAEKCETVADHIYGMVMIAWWIADLYFPQLDRERLIRMVLAHELGEIYTGDLVPADNIDPNQKHYLEREAFQRVVNKLPGGVEYLALWEDFEAGQSPEAQLARQIDRLEMGLQAFVYEQQGWGNMTEFYQSTEDALADPTLQEIFHQLMTLRR